MSKKPVQRQSQLITTFGPGAMVDLPTRSIVIGGINNWSTTNLAGREIREPALQRIMERWMRDPGRGWLPEGRALRFYAPPLEPNFNEHNVFSHISCPIFPTWFVCEKPETTVIGGRRREGRRIVHWKELEATNRRKYVSENGSSEVTPIRFVAGCEAGHLQDIDWRYALHQARGCLEQIWLIETGSSGSPEDILLACNCGQTRELRELSVPRALGLCEGHQPWLGGRQHRVECPQTPLQLLTRSATNAYFPQVARVISLPAMGDELLQLVERNWPDLTDVRTTADLAAARRFNSTLRTELGTWLDDEVLSRIELYRAKPESSGEINPKLAEFSMLASGAKLIGENRPHALLHAETLDRDACLGHGRYSQIRRVVAVRRLREVICLYTFTRFEPPAVTGDDIEEVALAVSGAPLGTGEDWLPAVEAFGEGIFIEFDPLVLATWESTRPVRVRAAQLASGVRENNKKKRNPEMPRPASFTAIHSLSHLLISEIALECGYPASSLRERIYAAPNVDDAEGKFGILIYTATTGALGTLGGLVDVATRLGDLLDRMIDRARLCSNDPVCADHDPSEPHDDRNLLGAACHGCLLIAETSCEWRNQFLDRELLVETVAQADAALFRRE